MPLFKRHLSRLSCASIALCGIIGCSDAASTADSTTSQRDAGAGSEEERDARTSIGTDGSARSGLSEGGTVTACNALTLEGSPVATMRAVTLPAPAPTGGLIEDGTYFLTESVIFGRPSDVPAQPWIRSKLVVRAGVWEQVNAGPGLGDASRAESLRASTSGVTLTLTKTCQPQAPQSFPYSATPGGFTTYTGRAEVLGMVYVRQ